jgi:hypothetical protein
MKRICLIVILAGGISAGAGCKKQQTAADGIREGIRQHLASLNTLNLSAMEMNVSNVTVNGNTAEAQVEYVPKTGAPAGAGMRVSYSLEKHGGQWAVVKTGSLGGAIDHPAPGANPHTQPIRGDVHGNLPNFRELIPPAGTPDAKAALPPGHPPVQPSPETKPKP